MVYTATAVLMFAGGTVEALHGVGVKTKNLEDVAQPLSRSYVARSRAGAYASSPSSFAAC
jgi:hypothetical protein